MNTNRNNAKRNFRSKMSNSLRLVRNSHPVWRSMSSALSCPLVSIRGFPVPRMALLFLLCSQLELLAGQAGLTTEANVMVEITFHGQGHYTDPFNQVKLDIVFTDPHGEYLRV